jgi:sugar phosphate permease
LLCSLTTLTYLDRICISIVGVRIKTELALSNEQFGWVLASFALAYALFEILPDCWVIISGQKKFLFGLFYGGRSLLR